MFLWDVASSTLTTVMTNIKNTLSRWSAFSMDGRTLASAEWTDVRLWNVASGKPLLRLRGLGVETRARPSSRPMGTNWL